ncbi:hypothetical protein KOW79_021441 [Hemibagrus wyckioides]|uniref:Uncharacterized protein n=1 Tax=Hemibagrus wyckioides TaxID=337641 RepID=A0A9D3N2W5_9TELE|nr:hypothetical protein KOW79_021441 [Hemibagrus wyckioides]
MHRPSPDNDQKHNKGPQRGSEMEKEEISWKADTEHTDGENDPIEYRAMRQEILRKQKAIYNSRYVASGSPLKVSGEKKVEHLPSFAEFVYVSAHLLDGGARPPCSEYNAVTISINQRSASWGMKTLKWFCWVFKCPFSPHS